MTCPYAAVPSPVAAGAPLAGPLSAAYPRAVKERYRSIEDPVLVRAILRRAEEFTPANALSTAVPLTPAALRILAAARFSLPPVLASASGTGHLAVRRVVAGFFSPAKVAAQAPFIGARVREICEELAVEYGEGKSVDLAQGLAATIPPEVMARLTGVASPPAESLKRWSQHSLELFWGWPGAERQLELAASAAEFYGWLIDAVDRAVEREDGNLYAALYGAGVEKRRIRSLAYFLAIAGQETTAMLIQSVIFSALHDGHWAACADPYTGQEAAKAVVAEVLAHASSVPTWRRIAAVDITIGAHEFRAGDELVLRLSGGLLGESADDSLAFGFGIHRCLGAGLARMETEVVLGAAARALPEIELASVAPDWKHLLSFQAPATVATRMRGRARIELDQPERIAS